MVLNVEKTRPAGRHEIAGWLASAGTESGRCNDRWAGNASLSLRTIEEDAPRMSDLHEGPLTPISQTHQPVPKLTAREQRRLRRKRRRQGEEILGWILVPVIVVGIYWGVTAGLDVLGTSPGQLWDQLMQVKAMLEKRS